MSDFRWLIEAPGLRYLSVRKLAGHDFHWTRDHDAALCFKDQQQADYTLMALRQLAPPLFDFEKTLGNASAVEHGWVGV